MAEQTKTGGPAFPAPELGAQDFGQPGAYPGMTLRQYAAIKLRVPNSGTDWLDEMIRQSMRDELAGKAMQRILSGGLASRLSFDDAYLLADAMLKAREVKHEQG